MTSVRSAFIRKFAVCLSITGLAFTPAMVLHAEETPAPEYTARVLGTKDEVTLASLRGQVVLLNTWATWCVPCRQEMPEFEAFYQRYRAKGVTVVGVSIDEGQSDAAVQKFVKALGVSFPIWRDPQNRFAKRFKVLGVPETLLIDREGLIAHHWRGAIDPGAPEQLKIIEPVIAAKAKAAQAPSGKSSAPAPVATAAAPAATTTTATTAEASSNAKRGRRLVEQRGCLNCHSIDGSPSVGPTWKGMLGSQAKLSDGREVARDKDYLARAIREPDAELVTGYSKGVMAGAMPGKPLTDADIDSLVLYLSSL